MKSLDSAIPEELELSGHVQVVGCGVGTVKSRLHYAKAAIRKRLEKLAMNKSESQPTRLNALLVQDEAVSSFNFRSSA